MVVFVGTDSELEHVEGCPLVVGGTGGTAGLIDIGETGELVDPGRLGEPGESLIERVKNMTWSRVPEEKWSALTIASSVDSKMSRCHTGIGA